MSDLSGRLSGGQAISGVLSGGSVLRGGLSMGGVSPAVLLDKADVITDTASGSIVSIPDGMASPVLDLSVGIEPIQTGTGEPSPDNIRPISGRSSVSVTRTGRNVLSKPFIYFNSEVASKDNSFYLPKGNYTFSFDSTNETSWRFILRLYNLDGTEITTGLPAGAGMAYRASVNGFTNGANTAVKSFYFTLDKNCYARILFWGGNTSATSTFNGTQLELGSTASSYEPYQGQAVTLQLGQTVYGGTVDVTEGKLTINMALVDMGARTWTYIQPSTSIPYGTFYNTIQNKKFGQTNLICSTYPVKQGFSNDHAIQGNAGASTVYVTDSTYNGDANALKTAVTGQTICYELATPVEVTLTAEELDILFGDNNIWSDSGSVSCSYRADTKLWILKKIAQALNA